MTSTFNPADIASGDTLTNGNLTLSETTHNTAVQGCRSTDSKASAAGLFYFEYTSTSFTSSNSGAGIANSTYGLTGPSFLGGDAAHNSVGFFQGFGVYYGGALQFSLAGTPSVATPLCIAIDTVHKKIWFRVGTGNWNNDVIANQNPATNTGGIDITTLLTNGPAFFCVSLGSTSDNATVVPAAPFTEAVPSGFSAWQAPASITGTITQTLPALRQQAAQAITGTISQTLLPLTQQARAPSANQSSPVALFFGF